MSDKIQLTTDELRAWDLYAAAAVIDGAIRRCGFASFATIIADSLILERRARASGVTMGVIQPVVVGNPCEKCGEGKVHVSYHPLPRWVVGSACFSGSELVPGHAGERHHVTCTRCGATWTEAVMGQEKRHG